MIKNKRLIKCLLLISSFLTIVFAALSIIYIHNWTIRVATQLSLSLTMVLGGIQTYFIKKQRLGILLWAIAAILLIVMITTIVVNV